MRGGLEAMVSPLAAIVHFVEEPWGSWSWAFTNINGYTYGVCDSQAEAVANVLAQLGFLLTDGEITAWPVVQIVPYERGWFYRIIDEARQLVAEGLGSGERQVINVVLRYLGCETSWTLLGRSQ